MTCFVCHKVGHISTDCPQLHPEEHEHDDDEEEEDEQPPELRFQWVHTEVLREYLDREFRHLSLSFPYSLERVIDDFIVICFLAGNDFLPRLPSGTLRSTTSSNTNHCLSPDPHVRVHSGDSRGGHRHVDRGLQAPPAPARRLHLHQRQRMLSPATSHFPPRSVGGDRATHQ